MEALNRPLRLVAVSALLLGALVWNANRIRALNPQPLPPHQFGIVSIFPGQIARLHVVNTADPCPAGQPCQTVQVEISFIDGDPDNPIIIGSVYNAMLAPGQSAHLDLNPDTAGIPPGPSFSNGRLEFRALVKKTILQFSKSPSPDPFAVPDPIVSTMEVLETIALNFTKVDFVYTPQSQSGACAPGPK